MRAKTYFPVLITLLVAMVAPVSSADCVPTPHRTTGTHYEPVTEQRADVGKGLVFEGRVLAMPDCRPVAGARVAHWQADQYGHYTDALRAYLYTDDQGRFRFETVWPNLRPPHIHFIASKDGYHTLETQWIGKSPLSSVNFDMVIEKQ